jgi:hypothetical protein
MRLSLLKAAIAVISSAAWQEIRVRSGRDDKSVCTAQRSSQGENCRSLGFARDDRGKANGSMGSGAHPQRRSGAPHLARFSRDVGYHGTRPATLSVVISLTDIRLVRESDGCPMFAKAYMGRKRWAQPFDRFCSDMKCRATVQRNRIDLQLHRFNTCSI